MKMRNLKYDKEGEKTINACEYDDKMKKIKNEGENDKSTVGMCLLVKHITCLEMNVNEKKEGRA